ncbi:hypothetical protein WMY93_027545 [Mugilogobius chulae]|uniref:Endonuclease/exonuclease/phosphatase domain-containing protein n=1 Tax=Mugilogobius chulae TaxID=88201 RepID=A0AAW0MXL4_9GOBI
MAPRCTGSHLPALFKLLFAIVLFCLWSQDISGLLIYDRQTLLDFKRSHEVFLQHKFDDSSSKLPPHLASVPAYLLRSPVLSCRKKRPRRRGRRGGTRVRVRAFWKANCGMAISATGFRGLNGLRWIQPVAPVRLPTGLRHLPVDSFSSFELQTFSLGLDTPIFCALVYRPPKFNKDFIKEFTDFLTGLALNHDKFLIVGDFNIHLL